MLTFQRCYTGKIHGARPTEPREPIAAESLEAFVEELFPWKAVWLGQQDPARVAVLAQPASPFGPEPRAVIEFLFDDLRGALHELTDCFDWEDVRVVGLPESLQFPSQRVRFSESPPADGAMVLSLSDLHRLYAAVQGGAPGGRLISVFIDPARNATICARDGQSLRKVLESMPAVAQFMDEHPESAPCHVFTGRPFDLDSTVVGPGMAFLVFPDESYAPAPSGGFFLSFPFFRSAVAMRQVEAEPALTKPCINCLACARVCPSGLYPSTLYHRVRAEELGDALKDNLLACIRCGRCTFVCPSALPLCGSLSGAIQTWEEQSE
jgi:ferredoxin